MLIDPRHLEQIAVIVDAGTLAQAAIVLGTSQPALSRMIGALEARIGMPVFERTRRPLRPTPIGHELAQQGRAIRSARLRATEIIKAGKRGFFGVLKIGAPPFLCERLVTEAIASFVAGRPDTMIDLVPDYSAGLLEKIYQNQIDLVIGPARFVEQGNTDLLLEPLFEDVNVIVGRAGHPLLAGQEIRARDLQDAIWIGHSSRSILRTDMEQALKLLGLRNLRFAFQSEAASAVIELLRNTDFLTILPRYAVKGDGTDGLSTGSLPLPDSPQLISVITLSDRHTSRLMADFVAHMRAHVAQRYAG